MLYVNFILDETKWLLQSKYHLDILYITLCVIGLEFSIKRKCNPVDANFQDCMHVLHFMHQIGRALPCIIKFSVPETMCFLSIKWISVGYTCMQWNVPCIYCIFESPFLFSTYNIDVSNILYAKIVYIHIMCNSLSYRTIITGQR